MEGTEDSDIFGSFSLFVKKIWNMSVSAVRCHGDARVAVGLFTLRVRQAEKRIMDRHFDDGPLGR